MSQDKDALVLELIKKVKIKKDEISLSKSPKWVTKCSFSFNPDGKTIDNVNIQTCSNIETLLDILAFLNNKLAGRSIAATMLNVPYSEKWQGYTVDEWHQDLKSRVNQINVNNQRAELKELETRLDKLVTPEQRRDLELAEIQRILGE